ncbi:MAG: RNase adapter RapZ [Alphaproteobacteria bacterium]|nr:RNase adapter RapZ [Alphaproteobacteria bacterium]
MQRRPVIVSGLSGAGMTSVLKALEDFGFEVFDNFPLSHVRSLCREIYAAADGEAARIAIGIDTRTRGFSPDAVLKLIKATEARLLFVSCDDAVLQRRFTETRRRHPLAGGQAVSYGIAKERDLLAPLQAKADMLIDTSDISVHDLRHILEGHFDVHPGENLSVSLISFGFRGGVPREADIIMDVRFLRNPHWDKALKKKTGKDKAVGDYIREDEDFAGFMDRFKGLIEPLLPRYAQEGKRYLTIAVGCTGGQHRSVFVTEELSLWLKGLGVKVFAEHRDL